MSWEERGGYVYHPLIYPGSLEYRKYQVEIAKEAYHRNTLVVLPTALGKTSIAALVAAEVLYNYPYRKVLVMAPTRPLALQHMESFRGAIRLPEEAFAALTGRVPAEERAEAWGGRARVFFATPQVVRNDAEEGRLSLGDFGLLVFDEAHRAVKEYAYTYVARRYVEEADYPLILGLTASPGSDVERARMVCSSLFIEHVEQRSEEDEDVRPYVNPVKVEWRRVKLPLAYRPASEILRGILESKLEGLRRMGYLRSSRATRKALVELGEELRYRLELSIDEERGPIQAALSLQASALEAFHMLELLESQGVHALRRFVERMSAEGGRGRASLLGELRRSGLLGLIAEGGPCDAEHPKVEALKEVVEEQLRSNPSSRILVFAQYRDTASHLVDVLNGLEGVRAARFVGQAARAEDRGLSQEEQRSLIRDLRAGRLNVLVATSIAEEGLDIPEVDLVVFYEPIPSEIRSLQRMGRTGRRGPGRVVVLVAEGTNDSIYLRASEARIRKMRELARRLNALLRPIRRAGPRPPPSPMSEEELERLPRSPPPPLGLPGGEAPGGEVARAARALYMKVLERGRLDAEDESLYEEMEEEGFSREAVAAALRRLLRERRELYARDGLVSVRPGGIEGAGAMRLEVKKVERGRAIVELEDGREAILLPENFEGPRELIRRGSSFTALCELYEDQEGLHAIVRRVLRVERGGRRRT